MAGVVTGSCAVTIVAIVAIVGIGLIDEGSSARGAGESFSASSTVPGFRPVVGTRFSAVSADG
jgi:hypothetical protein